MDESVVSLTKKIIWFNSTFFFSTNVWWVIYRNLLKFSFTSNFCNNKMSSIQSNIFWNSKVWFGNKNKRNISFPFSNKKFSNYWIQFFILNHISNHIIKNDWYFIFIIRIVMRSITFQFNISIVTASIIKYTSILITVCKNWLKIC